MDSKDKLALINVGAVLDVVRFQNLDPAQNLNLLVGDAWFSDNVATLGDLFRVFELAASEAASRLGCDVEEIS